MRTIAVATALVGGASFGGAQRAPKNVELSGTAKCANCGVRLEEVAMLGDAVRGPGRLEINAYAFDRDHKLAYVRGASRTEINAYDLTGKLQFTMGVHDRRPPAGARDNSFAMGPGDSLWVLDPNQQRVSVYGPATATVARNFRVRNRVERVLPIKDGQFIGVTSRTADTPDHVLVHVFSADGKPLSAIGAPPTSVAPRPAVSLSRRDGMVWIAHTDSYTIDQWTVDGSLMQTIHRNAPWYSSDAVDKARRDHGAPPAIVDLYEDEAGVLWVSAQKPNPTFRRRSSKGAGVNSDVLHVLEQVNVPSQRVEFADEVGLPLYRMGGDYFIEPNLHGQVATWRVVKLSLVKR